MGATVNDGVEHALDQAREPAAERDVRIAGGGATILEHLEACLVDEFSIALEPVRSEPSSRVTYLTYAVHPRRISGRHGQLRSGRLTPRADGTSLFNRLVDKLGLRA